MKTAEMIEARKAAEAEKEPPPPLTPDRIRRIEELAGRLGRGKSLRKKTTWPGGAVDIELEVLSTLELDEAIADASAYVCRKFGANDQVAVADVAECRQRRRCVEVLWRAIKEPGKRETVFRDADEFARVATEDEIMQLFLVYEDHRDSVDPDFTDMTEQEQGALAAHVKKKEGDRLRSIASSMPRRSLLTLVDLLVSSLTDSSSNT